MGTYLVGYRVRLRSGKTGVVKTVISDELFLVELDGGGGRLRIPLYDMMGLVGTQCLDGGAGRTVLFVPSREGALPIPVVRVLQAAYTNALDRLVRCKEGLSLQLMALDDKAPVSMPLQLASFICFNLPIGSRAVEYKNLISYCVKVVDGVARGMMQDHFVIGETDGKKLKLANGQMVAGYVPATALETLSAFFYGSSAYQSFSRCYPLEGEVHVNLDDFMQNSWQICSTLIHEATHKFCRTIDVHYIAPMAVTAMRTFITLARTNGPLNVEGIPRVVTMSDKTILTLKPEALLNNADSFAYFIMLMTD